MRKLLLLLGAVPVALLAVASPASAKDTFTCNRVSTYKFITVGDVVVPPNGFCSIELSTIEGDVTVQEGANVGISLSTIKGNLTVLNGAYILTSAIQIHGDLEGRGAKTIFLDGAVRVGGEFRAEETHEVALENSTFGAVEVRRTPNGFGDIHIFNNSITGDLEVDHNAAFMVVNLNRVGGDTEIDQNLTDLFAIGNSVQDMEVSDNTGSIEVASNRGQELQCEGNRYLSVGGPNFFAHTEGQCF